MWLLDHCFVIQHFVSLLPSLCLRREGWLLTFVVFLISCFVVFLYLFLTVSSVGLLFVIVVVTCHMNFIYLYKFYNVRLLHRRGSYYAVIITHVRNRNSNIQGRSGHVVNSDFPYHK